MNNSIIQIQNLNFGWDKSKVPFITIPELEVLKSEHLLIKGDSGSGKTTFLNLISGVLPLSSGEIKILEKKLVDASSSQRDAIRANHMGVIFQMFNLIPYLSVIENVLIPIHFSEVKRNKIQTKGTTAKEEAIRLLSELGLQQKEIHEKKVTELSVGQQQRVAAARALIGSPEIILADEPTSALDEKNAMRFLDLLLEECKKNNSTLLYVSHDSRIQQRFQKSISINDFTETMQIIEKKGKEAVVCL
ncbi:ABC transporter ATP-binding protein [Lutibacter sp. HS1-25]|uniref:ABC transporter ATP-binding protein n=1 Tax=Lutibacter sp. HS1-25 TaxID=2485000 RepID=UPI001012D14E|nr:ABC transporter ATP-binding protein [Lutibacter sp. HS1-25]RXP60925.1 ABC transporter ATP-binding protein [Lutibacter sp. HS1-25]